MTIEVRYKGDNITRVLEIALGIIQTPKVMGVVSLVCFVSSSLKWRGIVKIFLNALALLSATLIPTALASNAMEKLYRDQCSTDIGNKLICWQVN